MAFLPRSDIRRVISVCALMTCAVAPGARSAPLPPATVSVVPDDGKLPLGSVRYAKGDEYVDLAAAGYVEEEFYLSGVADAFSAVDGKALAVSQPYVTRILVVRPKFAARFSGTVVVEPFSFRGERAGGWTKIRRHVLKGNDVWVGVTLLSSEQASSHPGGPPGLQELKTFDAARYDKLKIFEAEPGTFMRATRTSGGKPAQDSFAPQGQMILAELAALIKSNKAESPLKGFDVRRLYTLTWQVQGELWMDYLKQGRHQAWRLADGRPLIDGYMLGNYSGLLPLPQNLPDDAPLVIVRSVREVSNNARDGLAAPPDSDQPKFRLYDFNGSAHIGSRDVGSGELQIKEVSSAEPPPHSLNRAPKPPVCSTGLRYDESVEPVITALFAGMDQWVQHGRKMPRAPRVDLDGTATVKDSATGNLKGGLQPPWIEVPVASYLVGDEVGCGASDVKVLFDAKVLKDRYGDYATYLKQYDAAIKKDVSAGYILPDDAGQVTPVAHPQDFQ